MERRQSFLPRWLHRLYANTNGYFWLPCAICGDPFGGHERSGASISVPGEPPTLGQIVCRRCVDHPRVHEHRARQDRYFASILARADTGESDA